MADNINEYLDATEAGEETPTPDPAAAEETETSTEEQPTQEIPEHLRPYITELREEAAKYRTRAKPFNEAFDGYSTQEVDLLLDIVHTLKQDLTTGAHKMRDLAYRVIGEDEEVWNADAPWATQAQAEEIQETGTVAMTPEQIQELIDKQVQAKLQESSKQAEEKEYINNIRSQAAELGYEPGSAMYEALVTEMVASEVNMQQAHENLQKQFAEKFGQPAPVKEATFPPVVQGGQGAGGQKVEPPTNVRDATKAMREWLNDIV